MLQDFKDNIDKNFPFLFEKKLLIAVSAGVDSMVLSNLCLSLNLNISLAHCNFCLRGEESDDDEAFVKSFAFDNDVKFYSKRFETEPYAKSTKQSIQMAARKLRYDWFSHLSENNGYDYILTAHHADDNLETFFINLSRGAGLHGLIGIPKYSTQLVRPLLNFSKQQIITYANKLNIKWREDKSNTSLKYQRNHVRKEISPALKRVFPNILSMLKSSQENLTSISLLLKNHISKIQNNIIIFSNSDEKHYDINELKKLDPIETYLYLLFCNYGFSDSNEILKILNSQSGKQIFSNSHRMIKDRDVLILVSISHTHFKTKKIFKDDSRVNLTDLGNTILIQKVARISDCKKNSIYVDYDKLEFPLEVRTWIKGDYFYPNGLNGKKKLSKFFKDLKFNLLEKSKILLLCSNSKIIWVIGHRQDSRYISDESTKTICKISFE